MIDSIASLLGDSSVRNTSSASQSEDDSEDDAVFRHVLRVAVDADVGAAHDPITEGGKLNPLRGARVVTTSVGAASLSKRPLISVPAGEMRSSTRTDQSDVDAAKKANLGRQQAAPELVTGHLARFAFRVAGVSDDMDDTAVARVLGELLNTQPHQPTPLRIVHDPQTATLTLMRVDTNEIHPDVVADPPGLAGAGSEFAVLDAEVESRSAHDPSLVVRENVSRQGATGQDARGQPDRLLQVDTPAMLKRGADDVPVDQRSGLSDDTQQNNASVERGDVARVGRPLQDGPLRRVVGKQVERPSHLPVSDFRDAVRSFRADSDGTDQPHSSDKPADERPLQARSAKTRSDLGSRAAVGPGHGGEGSQERLVQTSVHGVIPATIVAGSNTEHLPNRSLATRAEQSVPVSANTEGRVRHSRAPAIRDFEIATPNAPLAQPVDTGRGRSYPIAAQWRQPIKPIHIASLGSAPEKVPTAADPIAADEGNVEPKTPLTWPMPRAAAPVVTEASVVPEPTHPPAADTAVHMDAREVATPAQTSPDRPLKDPSSAQTDVNRVIVEPIRTNNVRETVLTTAPSPGRSSEADTPSVSAAFRPRAGTERSDVIDATAYTRNVLKMEHHNGAIQETLDTPQRIPTDADNTSGFDESLLRRAWQSFTKRHHRSNVSEATLSAPSTEGARTELAENVGSEPTSREVAEVRPSVVQTPLVLDGATVRNGTPDNPVVSHGNTSARSAHVDVALEAPEPRKGDTASIRVEDGDGNSTIVRVTVRGDQVRTNIVSQDRHVAGQLAANSEQLRDALNARGFQDTNVSIRASSAHEMQPGSQQHSDQPERESREYRDGRYPERDSKHDRRDDGRDSKQGRQQSDRRPPRRDRNS